MNPDRIAKTMIPAVVLMPYSAKMTTAQPAPLKMRRLKTPYLGARMFGMIRPNMDDALRMAS